MKTTHDDGTTAESRLSFGLLPVELQVHVLGFVPPLDVLLNASLVCRCVVALRCWSCGGC
jgi:hypothetical protein